MYWLVGQFAAHGLVEGCGPDVVRLGAKNFADEVRQPRSLLEVKLTIVRAQAVPAKLQLLTLSAKLLVLSHLSPLSPHLRLLSLLFNYLALLARYDLAYEVRDRARFLAGLVASGGIGKGKGRDEEGESAKVMLGEEEFRQGLQVEDVTGSMGANGQEEAEEKESLTAEQVRRVLFEGKTFDGISRECALALSASRSLTTLAQTAHSRPKRNSAPLPSRCPANDPLQASRLRSRTSLPIHPPSRPPLSATHPHRPHPLPRARQPRYKASDPTRSALDSPRAAAARSFLRLAQPLGRGRRHRRECRRPRLQRGRSSR